MTASSSRTIDQDTKRAANSLVGWLLFPFALFPLVALLTYDPRAIAVLQMPPLKSSNWIGALGDYFAYYGYLIFGFAIWIIPAVCILAGILRLANKRLGTGKRKFFIILFVFSSACLLQVTQGNIPFADEMLAKVNTPDMGGAIGYLAMTRFLSPLVSDFGASIIMLVILIGSVISTIGLGNLGRICKDLYYWAMLGGNAGAKMPAQGGVLNAPPSMDKLDVPEDPREAQLRAIREAKAAAKRQREAEKERMRLEKEEAREAAREAKRTTREFGIGNRELPKATKPGTRAPNSTVAAGEGVPDKGPYLLPPVNLLSPVSNAKADHSDTEATAKRLIDTLSLFGIDATLSYKVEGPVVTKYAVKLKPGTRYNVVTALSDNLMGALHAKSLRIEAPIPGEDNVGIEVPNTKPVGISFREIFEGDTFRNARYELPLLFGKDAAGRDLVADLATMPHMLVAGATGQGKSVCLNAIINGLLMTRTPEQLKLIMVDPKSVEFKSYENIPHLLVPVITDNRKVVYSLAWAVVEMEKRLKLFASAKVRNIKDFNSRKIYTQPDMFGTDDNPVNSGMPKSLPYIVIIIDEVADLMQAASKEVTPHISRLTAKARAAGIHLILATQRPDAKIITGTIKANIPGRVAFKTATAIDSRTILDDSGAENLIGRGDMLFKSKDGLLIRAQGALISDADIGRITQFIEEHSNPQFDQTFATKLGRVKEAGIEDPFASNKDDPDNQERQEEPAAAAHAEAKNDDLVSKAIEVIINTKRASVSHFQRRLGIGYNNSARLCDKLEEMGIIGPQSTGAGPRSILMTPEELTAIMNKGSESSASTEDSAMPQTEIDHVAPPEESAKNTAVNEGGNGFYISQDDLFADP